MSNRKAETYGVPKVPAIQNEWWGLQYQGIYSDVPLLGASEQDEVE
jgi:hypothetical protein